MSDVFSRLVKSAFHTTVAALFGPPSKMVAERVPLLHISPLAHKRYTRVQPKAHFYYFPTRMIADHEPLNHNEICIKSHGLG
jgi:hypothetical protein